MIQITRLNKHPFVVNSDWIKFIEQSPDTVITLMNGEKIVVLETAEQVIERVLKYRRQLLEGLGTERLWVSSPVSGPTNPPEETS